MDLGLQGCRVALWGSGSLVAHCAELFAAEGSQLIDPAGDLAACDALVAIAPRPCAVSLEEMGDGAAFAAWQHVPHLAERCRAATEGMAARRHGRIVWVGPLEAKVTRDDLAADLGALVALGAL